MIFENFFGTDGIRGTYGKTIDDKTAYLLGRSLTFAAEDNAIVVIARDTRNSGEKLASALAAGVYEGGGNVLNLGVLPTNAVAHFTRKFGADYGVMITASHNPPCDNGLKVFDQYGVKLCLRKQRVLSVVMNGLCCPDVVPHVNEPVFYDINKTYVDDVLSAVDVDLSGVRVALDCCFGASCLVAPTLFGKAQADVVAYNNKPNGNKINVECGATCPQHLQSKLADTDTKLPQLSFAFDGDCDRLLVFEGANIVPNNKVFFAIAKFLSQQGMLKKSTVVGTVLTNGGVEQALKSIGIKLLRSDVGDVKVFELMAQNALNFGGEESGHYILSDLETSSDALVNALFVSKIFKQKGSLLQYTAECVDIPYVQQSFVVSDTCNISSIQSVIQQTKDDLQVKYPSCRFVLRKSGTESKIRAYVEGDKCVDAMQQIADVFCR